MPRNLPLLIRAPRSSDRQFISLHAVIEMVEFSNGRMIHRSRLAEGGFKPPKGAVVKSHGAERLGKGFTTSGIRYGYWRWTKVNRRWGVEKVVHSVKICRGMNAVISTAETCLLAVWQASFRRHELYLGFFFTELGNLYIDVRLRKATTKGFAGSQREMHNRICLLYTSPSPRDRS